MTEQESLSVFGWTVDSLHAHVQAVISSNDRRYMERFTAVEKLFANERLAYEKALTVALDNVKEATDKLERSTQLKFEGVNEWRQTVSDKDKNNMPRSEIESQFTNLREKIGDLFVSRGTGVGKELSTDRIILFMFSLAGILLAGISLIRR